MQDKQSGVLLFLLTRACICVYVPRETLLTQFPATRLKKFLARKIEAGIRLRDVSPLRGDYSPRFLLLPPPIKTYSVGDGRMRRRRHRRHVGTIFMYLRLWISHRNY